MSKEPEIVFQKIVTLNKILRVPDARYKSGYRENKIIATNTAVIPNELEGTTIAQNHIHKVGNKLYQTAANAHIVFQLETAEREL